MRIAALVIAGILFAATTTFAQARGMGRFAGVVVDDSGAPVEGVQITAKHDSSTGVMELKSDAKGSWTVAGIGKGVWMVEFRKPGFAPKAAKVILERELDKVPAIKLELKKG
jgi:hypothetical protein